MTTHITPVDSSKTLNEIIEANPDTLEVFHRFGFDTCCGGTLPLAEVAVRHGLDLETILQALSIQQKK